MGFFSRFAAKSEKTEKKSVPFRTTPATARRIKNILHIESLGSMPAQAARAFNLASDPKAGPGDFVSLIEGDEALTSRIVRIANSVYFLRGEPVNDIERAVVNIGLEELRCLLSASMLQNLLSGKHPARKQIWANAVATGIGCRILSTKLSNVSDGEAFLCGLVHDVGKLIMLQKNAQDYEKVLDQVARTQCSFIDAEETIFTTNHVEVGQWGAETWNFPPNAVLSIAYHHRPWSKEELSIPVIVKVADKLSHIVGIGHPPHFSQYREKSREELTRIGQILGIDRPELETLLERLQVEVEQELGFYEDEL